MKELNWESDLHTSSNIKIQCNLHQMIISTFKDLEKLYHIAKDILGEKKEKKLGGREFLTWDYITNI